MHTLENTFIQYWENSKFYCHFLWIAKAQWWNWTYSFENKVYLKHLRIGFEPPTTTVEHINVNLYHPQRVWGPVAGMRTQTNNHPTHTPANNKGLFCSLRIRPIMLEWGQQMYLPLYPCILDSSPEECGTKEIKCIFCLQRWDRLAVRQPSPFQCREELQSSTEGWWMACEALSHALWLLCSFAACCSETNWSTAQL